MMAPNVSFAAVKGALQVKDFVFHEPGQYLIGRSSDCAIQLPQDNTTMDVSRHHCLVDINLDVLPPIVRVRDLGSRNGTYVNGCKIGQRRSQQAPEDADLSECAYCRLVNDDEVQVGHTVFKVGIHTDGERPQLARVQRAEEVKSPGLEVLGHVGPFWW
jgi:pSer/pThr/pTyr-binding forkhead associated (FHA) protein